jgi:hypothetical protein
MPRKTWHRRLVAAHLCDRSRCKEQSNTREVIMKRLFLSLLILILVPMRGTAQRAEIFGGVQYTHLQPSYNALGWNLAVTGNFKHFLGITGDFSGAYNSNVDFHSYTVGPVLSARLPVVQPFVHALFGGATLSVSGTSTTDFAMLVGGGLDIGLRRGIAIRLIQADWLSTRFGGAVNNSQGRASAGLVLKF